MFSYYMQIMHVHSCCFSLERVQNCALLDAVVCSIFELREGIKSDFMFLPPEQRSNRWPIINIGFVSLPDLWTHPSPP